MPKSRKYICYSPEGKRVETDYLNYCDLVNHNGYMSSPDGGEDETADTRLERAEDAVKAAETEAKAAKTAAGKAKRKPKGEDNGEKQEEEEDEDESQEGAKEVSSVAAMQAAMQGEMIDDETSNPPNPPTVTNASQVKRKMGRPSKK